MKKLEAFAIIIGTTIGAGILGIPYAVAKVGFVPGLVMLMGLGLATTILELMYAEVTLRTREDHEMPGYSGLYLGFPAKMTTLVLGIIGGYGALLAYIIGEGNVLSTLLSGTLGGTSFSWGLLFFAVASYIVYRGLEAVRVIELVMVTAMFGVVVALGLTAQPHINPLNLAHVDVNNIIVPYGVLMFALSGISAIPQVRLQMKGSEKSFPYIIIAANLAVMVIYALFIWLTLGVTGAQTTEIATVGLGHTIGRTMLVLGNTLAFITMSTSFIAGGLAMRRLFQFDYGFSRFKAWLSTMIIPLTLFVIGARGFIQVLGIVGGVIISMHSIIIVSAFWKARMRGHRKPEFDLGSMRVVGAILILLYIFGSVLTLLDHV